MSNVFPSTKQALAKFYREHLETSLMPFWLERAVDFDRGGVFTCIENSTGKRVSEDKFVWSQGRFAWLMAHASMMVRRGLLSGDADLYEKIARDTADFILEHGYTDDGRAVFLLTADGQKKESIPGQGYDISYFVDCFAIIGLSGVASATGEMKYAEAALRNYDDVKVRLAEGSARTEPYPMPPGCKTHSTPMIMLNVSETLERALFDVKHPRRDSVGKDALGYMDEILNTFMLESGLIQEAICECDNKLLTTHVNPGHTVESMWFLLEQAGRYGRTDAVQAALKCIKATLDVGWDKEYGGIMRYVMPDGSIPTGTSESSSEDLILDTWHTKIWWPHSEALYTTALAGLMTGDEEMWRLHEKVWQYTFDTFPNPDPAIGEWINIRDREGNPIDKVVGLPVKDPFHIIRNLMLAVEILDAGVETRGGPLV